MEDLCQRIPHVSAKIFGFVENQTLVKCKESSKTIYNLMETQRFFWIRIIQAHEGSIQDSWKKVVDKTPIAIIKDFSLLIQQFFNLESRHGYRYKEIGQIWSPLYIAARIGHAKLCKYVGTKTANENHSHGGMKLTDLHIAVCYGRFETFRLIFENVANKNPRNALGETPLQQAVEEAHQAAVKGHQDVKKAYFEICNLIISNVDDKNPEYHKYNNLGVLSAGCVSGQTLFHITAGYGQVEICKLFIDNLINKNPCDNNGNTPLYMAARSGHLEVCTQLMENLLDKNPRNYTGWTPLHSAAMEGHLDVCEVLMENLLDKNPRNDNDYTPLHAAAFGGHLEVYKLILGNAQDKTPENVGGDTPLHSAAMMGHFYMCKFILEHANEKNPINNVGQTPRSLAHNSGHMNIVYLIDNVMSNRLYLWQ